MIRRGNKYSNPLDLGPWNFIYQGKDASEVQDEEEDRAEQKIPYVNNNKEMRLPRINLMPANQTARSNKLTLKLSQNRLQLPKQLRQTNSTRSRYGKMNGSVLHFYKGNSKDANNGRKSIYSEAKSMEVGGSAHLQRKVSTILLGEPLGKSKEKEQRNTRILLNAEAAKKRSLHGFMREVFLSKQLLNIYFQKREKH